MCTVSIVPLADGFRIGCNRDERLTRGVAQPPAVHDTGGRRALYPVDPDGLGTWIGVNDEGLAAVLLNRSRGLPSGARRSRGAIVPALLSASSIEGALLMLHDIDPADFAAFAVLVVQGRALACATGNGRTLAASRWSLREPVVFASSSLGDALVEKPRRALFERLVSLSPHVLFGQDLFHAHRWSERPDLSVMMQRDDARTVSRTFVTVSGGQIDMQYEPL